MWCIFSVKNAHYFILVLCYRCYTASIGSKIPAIGFMISIIMRKRFPHMPSFLASLMSPFSLLTMSNSRQENKLFIFTCKNAGIIVLDNEDHISMQVGVYVKSHPEPTSAWQWCIHNVLMEILNMIDWNQAMIITPSINHEEVFISLFSKFFNIISSHSKGVIYA